MIKCCSVLFPTNLEDASQVAARDVDAHVRLVLTLHLVRQHHLPSLLEMSFKFLQSGRCLNLERTFEPVSLISTSRLSLASVRFTLYNPENSLVVQKTFELQGKNLSADRQWQRDPHRGFPARKLLLGREWSAGKSSSHTDPP